MELTNKTKIFHGVTCILGISGFYLYKELYIKTGEKILIGRDREKCTLLYPPNFTIISKIHCELYIDNETKNLLIVDRDSKNGTFLKNEKLSPNIKYTLKNGDKFYLGTPQEKFEVILT